MYKQINGCRACGYGKVSDLPYVKDQAKDEKLIPVFDLGLQPLANDFKDYSQEHAGFAPLKVLFCPNCTLGQLSVVVKPEILYANYPYVTSRSATMKEHFGLILQDLKSEQPINSVIEIGSNDGYFLKFCKDRGVQTVLGIDGADNLTKIAEADGVPTIKKFFNSSVARDAYLELSNPDLIVARHVLCHIDNWTDFFAGLEQMADSQTLIFIEVPYAGDMLNRAEFDSIYHEHLSYLTIRAIAAVLCGTRLRIHRIIKYGIHGGAVGILLRHDASGIAPHPSADAVLLAEDINRETWAKFNVAAHNEMRDLQVRVANLIEAGKTVCGYGASAKSTVWINACGFTRKEIKFVTDTTPQKQWKNIPGTDIPVVDEAAIVREQPDAAVLFAWNYAKEILEKERAFTDRGGKFIIPHS